MQLLFTPCDILDVTWPQKQNSDSVWVSLAALGSCQLHFDNVSWQCLLACWGFNLCFKNQHIFGRFSRKQTWLAVECFDSVDQFQDLVQFLADLCSSFVRKQPKREQKRKLLDCCIPVRLHTSAGDWACEVRDQTPMRHTQWLCTEKVIALLAGRRSQILEGCCKLFPKGWFCWKHLCSLSSSSTYFSTNFLTIFYVFFLLNLSTKRCLSFFPSQNLLVFKRRQILLKKAFIERFQKFNQLPVRNLIFWDTVFLRKVIRSKLKQREQLFLITHLVRR